MLDNITIYKSGKVLKEAIDAVLNAHELTPDISRFPDPSYVLKLQMIKRNVVPSDQYQLRVTDLEFLNL